MRSATTNSSIVVDINACVDHFSFAYLELHNEVVAIVPHPREGLWGMRGVVDYTRTTTLPLLDHALAKEDATFLDRTDVSVTSVDEAVATEVSTGLNAFVQLG